MTLSLRPLSANLLKKANFPMHEEVDYQINSFLICGLTKKVDDAIENIKMKPEGVGSSV